jgi:hypothetical protein
MSVMDNEKRMILWCRMWSEDPSLAHDLMSDDCVQWSGNTGGLDAVVGPDEQERFVTGYRARHVNVFSPRVLVDAGDWFAYLWDVRKPDGQVLTGVDVNLLDGASVRENWTFVAERRCELPDPGPEAAGRTDPGTLDELCRRWLRLRNGRADLAPELVTDDFALFVGAGPVGAVHGASELAELVGRGAAADGPAVVAVHRQPVVDPGQGRLALLWTAGTGAGGNAVSGVDLLTVRHGRFAHAWSLAGTRSFAY